MVVHTRRLALGGIVAAEPREVAPVIGRPSRRQSRPSLLLPGAVGITQAVNLARDALCALLTMRPDACALDRWLIGPYREATHFASKTPPVAGRAEDETSILQAQRRAAHVIEAACHGAEALVRLLPAVVHIRRAHDRFGGRGFVPLDVAGAPLVDKALALALADFFTRPDEFLEHEFVAASAPLRRLSSEMCATVASPDEPKH